MRRFLQKPAEMEIKEYVARVVEIKDYLPQFPPCVHWGIPRSYKTTSYLSYLRLESPLSGETKCTSKFLRRKNTQSRNLPRCVRGLSLHLGTLRQTNQPIRDPFIKTNPMGTRNVVAKPATKQTEKRSSTVSCMGKNPTHNTNDCRTLKRQAKEQKKSLGGKR